jgi:hypothetical protein
MTLLESWGPAPALIVLTPGGAALAARLKAVLPAALVHAKRGRVEAADVFFDDFTAALQAAFLQGRPIVGLCAAGTLIRALAPLIADKQAEPPVVAVAEDGSAVVPLQDRRGPRRRGRRHHRRRPPLRRGARCAARRLAPRQSGALQGLRGGAAGRQDAAPGG